MTTIITCPSGLTGKIRGLKVREEKLLTDRKLAKSGKQYSELLKACWVETIDVGPYCVSSPDRFSLDDALSGDRFYTLLQIRMLTYGSELELKLECPRAACGESFYQPINLDELKVRELPQESKERIRSGELFPLVLPECGTRVLFRLSNGKTEEELAKLGNVEDRITEVLLRRIVKVEGIEPSVKAYREFISELGLGDVNALQSEVDRVDCGVETNVTIACPECGKEFDLELPLDRMFIPKRANR